ncbi:exonuclease SbcC [Paenibacillus algorifonticola]|uniref:Nuclease SbcCD subunit C n=1 Tax=Paenibacillus algorifonticola TaxID=684063 RepID=A0A1I2B973_9BACL|nr:SMC family ATPase [Paenibacillus algorifonticola]SFE51710.1 exonuclease SbcC [Paenibacillus algorifonticola]
MRPLKLTMNAFGPYRDAESIDFAQLDEHRLFVISGSTGAGKTSIFDAICFALYGAASGEDRSEARMLRSHFAGDDTHTSVEFHFAVAQREYQVFRQLPHRKGSNKSETGGKAELYEFVDGQAVPLVDRFQVRDVDAKLESIIGLTKEQFNQIVMLPQGEFRKLLTSDTDNKEEILRRIFRTELYEKLELRFQQQNRELNETLKEARLRNDMYMKQAGDALPQREGSLLAATLSQEVYNAAQLLASLEQEAAYYGELVQQGDVQRQQMGEQLLAQEEKLRAALALNARFEELAAERSKLEQLELGRAAQEAKGRELQLAEQAALLTPYEEQASRAGKDAEAKQQVSEAKQREAEAAKQALAAASQRHASEEQREPERREAERELNRLEELAPAVQQMGEQRQAVTELRARAKQGQAQLEREDAAIAAEKEAKQQSAARLKLMESDGQQLLAKQEQFRRVEQQGKYVSKLIKLEQELAEFKRLEESQEQALSTVRAQHDGLEQQWIEGQAGLLAAHLHDGKPCPVCGSVEHPGKIQTAADVPSREQLAQAKEQLAACERELNASRLQVAAARSGWESSAAELAEYGASVEHLAEQQADLRTQWKQLKDETDRLQQQNEEMRLLKEQAEKREAELERLIRDKEQRQAAYQQVQIELGAKESLLARELERIPEPLRGPEQLQQALVAQRMKVRQHAEAWQAAVKQLQQAQLKETEASVNAVQARQQFEEALRSREEAQERLLSELRTAAFDSLEAYRAAAKTPQERQALKEQLDAYKSAVQALASRVTDMQLELAGKQPADMQELHAAGAELRQQLETIVSALQTAARHGEEAARLIRQLTATSERVKQLEAELEQVLDIYQMLKGDNALKISFERYILIEFLEQILQAANVRLQRLSGGQFMLQRSDRLEVRGKQSGLGLDVYDAYTGQNRDVKTMSGGEKFNASLCLALGMTDVIQAHQGGISIEMMFIDEGFGSLDEEALNKAIEALVDLQRAGRMIGVISHVQELKQAFPACLEVHKTKEGYSRTAVTVR